MYRAVPVAGGAGVCTCCLAPKRRAIYAERLARKVAICNYYHRYLVRPAANSVKARGLPPQAQPVSRSLARPARGPSPIDSALGAHHKILTQKVRCLPARWAHAYPAQLVTCRDLKLGRPRCRSARRPCHETESVGWHERALLVSYLLHPHCAQF